MLSEDKQLILAHCLQSEKQTGYYKLWHSYMRLPSFFNLKWNLRNTDILTSVRHLTISMITYFRKGTSTIYSLIYCISNKSCLILIVYSLQKNGQDFLYIQYLVLYYPDACLHLFLRQNFECLKEETIFHLRVCLSFSSCPRIDICTKGFLKENFFVYFLPLK